MCQGGHLTVFQGVMNIVLSANISTVLTLLGNSAYHFAYPYYTVSRQTGELPVSLLWV